MTTTKRSKNGKKLGKYEVEKQIGKGSAANIYLARHDSLGRKLVIKELLPLYESNEKIVARFQREAKLVSQLNHDCIIHIYDYWIKSNSYYMAMEYIPGQNLRKILSLCHYLPVPIAAMMMYQICRGLEHAHSRGVIHRDLKPANIMISDQGQVKILDFGIAHFQMEDNLTSFGAVIGTYNYMSPEQALGKQVTPASDIFSLGILFYELLTGMKPFAKDDKGDVLEKIIRKHPVPVRRRNPAVPRSFGRIIRKCLRKKPGRRFQDVQQIKKPLERYLRRQSLDHQAVLQEFLQNLTPRKTDKSWPPVWRRRVWYRITHQPARTYAAAAAVLILIAWLEYRWITGGITLPIQWETTRQTAMTAWSGIRAVWPFTGKPPSAAADGIRNTPEPAGTASADTVSAEGTGKTVR